ncbi:hypothetical protein GN956_G6793 [Arapaima gigas]
MGCRPLQLGSVYLPFVVSWGPRKDPTDHCGSQPETSLSAWKRTYRTVMLNTPPTVGPASGPAAAELHLCKTIQVFARNSVTMKRIVLALLWLAALCMAQKRRQQSSEWDYRAGAEKVNTRGCSNLTLVLDNWKFAIMTQMKDLLLNNHKTVLPDYGRIQPLSDALGDLYKEFNGLKEHIRELTSKVEVVEAFVDDFRAGKLSGPPSEVHQQHNPQSSSPQDENLTPAIPEKVPGNPRPGVRPVRRRPYRKQETPQA